MLSVILFLSVFVVGFLVFVRLAPSDPAVWHVDPETTKPPRKRNFSYGVRLALEQSPQDLLSQIETAMLKEPDTHILAGSVEDLHITFETRSKLLKYPDYFSVKAAIGEDGTDMWFYSRARFGYNDLGVNKARVNRVLKSVK